MNRMDSKYLNELAKKRPAEFNRVITKMAAKDPVLMRRLTNNRGRR